MRPEVRGSVEYVLIVVGGRALVASPDPLVVSLDPLVVSLDPLVVSPSNHGPAHINDCLLAVPADAGSSFDRLRMSGWWALRMSGPWRRERRLAKAQDKNSPTRCIGPRPELRVDRSEQKRR
jgi:hypothetical protein